MSIIFRRFDCYTFIMCIRCVKFMTCRGIIAGKLNLIIYFHYSFIAKYGFVANHTATLLIFLGCDSQVVNNCKQKDLLRRCE